MLAAVTSPFGRALYRWELDVIQEIYGSGVDAGRIRLVEAHFANAPTTLGNQIRVPPGWSFDRDNRPVLVHEVGHVWQYQTQGTGYISDSVYHNASGQIATGNRNVAYINYRLLPGSSITDFTAEEQATIIGDYYELTRIYQGVANPPSWTTLRSADLPIYERLIAQVRASTPKTDAMVYHDSLMNRPGPANMDVPEDRRLAPTMPIPSCASEPDRPPPRPSGLGAVGLIVRQPPPQPNALPSTGKDIGEKSLPQLSQ